MILDDQDKINDEQINQRNKPLPKKNFMDEVMYSLNKIVMDKSLGNQEKDVTLEAVTEDNSDSKKLPIQGMKRKKISENDDERLLFSCDQCSHQTTNIGNLKKHVIAKHEVARYQCLQCEYKIGTSQSLKAHIDAKHEGIFYSCDRCEYKATVKGNLKTHIESKHEGVCYSCDQCEYRANLKGNLKQHKEAIHDGIRYPCDQCKYKGTAKWRLKRHADIMHRNKSS